MKRPNADIKFYESSDELYQTIKELYIDTGKCISWRTPEYLDDAQLEIKITSVWKDRASVDEALENVSLIEDGFLQVYYNIENNIETISVEIDGVSIMGNSYY
jgi:hypothetical protein